MPHRAVPERLIGQLLANPLASQARELDQAAAELAQYTPSDAEHWESRKTGPYPLRRGLLAVLHARAHLHLAADGGESAKQPWKPAAGYAAEARIALASARCTARLRHMVGASDALDRVRQDTWTACFGRSLLHGLALERLVRQHDVLITGETGVGKEQVARAVGEGTPGSQAPGAAPFAELNAAAVPDTLVESELFGYAKGAFTGAHAARKGLVRSADGGCMFLDEVGDLPAPAQAKLLRVIETDRVQPLGTEQVYIVDVRFVAATHHDLRARAEQGTFRADLFQRLGAVVIRVPPLRERPEDIAPIGEYFLAAATSGAAWPLDTREISRWLLGQEARQYSWPGNARELRNVVGNLLLGLPSGIAPDARTPLSVGARVPRAVERGEASLAALETWYLARVLQQSGGNAARAARVLGVDRTTIVRKIRQARNARSQR
jgi:DNA-binding NtrC family response regulator